MLQGFECLLFINLPSFGKFIDSQLGVGCWRSENKKLLIASGCFWVTFKRRVM